MTCAYGNNTRRRQVDIDEDGPAANLSKTWLFPVRNADSTADAETGSDNSSARNSRVSPLLRSDTTTIARRASRAALISCKCAGNIGAIPVFR